MSTEGMVQQAQLREPKSGEGVYELPCGYLDESGKLHTDVVVREITGNEEDMLASKSIQPIKKMSELITRCLMRVGDIADRSAMAKIVKELPVGDRVFLIFAIRRVTFGDVFPFEDICPNEDCKAKRLYEIDLSSLELRKMPHPTQRVFEGKLPDGIPVRFRTLTGADEERLAKFSKLDDAISQAMLLRTESFDGKPADLMTIKSLSMKKRQALRDLFESEDGGVETSVEMECPACGEQFEREIEVGSTGFFFPSEIQKNSKTKSST